MDFGKYIHQLLLENDIVIVPGFGAFVSDYKPAEISNDGDEIKPPSKIVSFNQQIRNNDGLLVGHVATLKRISHFDALKRIEKERENILYKLDSGEQIEIDEIGTLYYTEDHTIAFRAEEAENLLLDSFGLEATSIELEDENEGKNPVVTPQAVSEPQKPEQEEKEEPTKVDVPIRENKIESTKEEPEENKRKRGWLWLLLVLIPLIAVSVFLFMKGNNNGGSDKIIKNKPASKTIEQPLIVTQDSAKLDTIKVTPPDTVTVKKSQDSIKVETDFNTQKYYLVGGSFSVKENADTFLEELKNKNFEAFHVGKKGRFFIIGIGVYDTFSAAEKAKKDYMTDNPGSEVWVWKK